MKIEINKYEFIRSNMLKLNSDVEIIFRIDTNFGLQGQLLKLEKSNNITSFEYLNILLGRYACIIEEWNYQEFKEEEWGSIFEPKRELIENILKTFEPLSTQLFLSEFNEFRKYFIYRTFEQLPTTIKIKPNYLEYYKFDGINVDQCFKFMKPIKDPSKLNFGIFNNEDIKTVIANRNKWNWKLWFVETHDNSFLFEEIITT